MRGAVKDISKAQAALPPAGRLASRQGISARVSSLCRGQLVMHPAVERAHRQLIERLIARGSLWSPHLITAFRETPRHYFIDRIFTHDPQSGRWNEALTVPLRRSVLRQVYSDRALTTRLSAPDETGLSIPLSSSSQPSLMAEMLEDLCLAPGVRTLEIGAGTGYNAALIARAAGAVTSLDVDDRVIEEARRHLERFSDRPVELVTGDGRAGWPARAPYERVVVTASAVDLQPAWLSQISPGGVIQVPLTLAPGLAFIARGAVTNEVFVGSLTRQAYFISLRSQSPDESGAPSELKPVDPNTLETVSAPWRDWAPRSSNGNELPFLRSLAFLGWLEGCAVDYQSIRDEGVFFGVGETERGVACWFGQTSCRVTGSEGAELGNRLWSTFLDHGGPFPTEFRLIASARGEGLPESFGTALRFRRRGPLTEQLWELDKLRERAPGR
jgi:protein-L-isoaspartate(D-aspartate) O-methyltransferase